MNKAMNNRNTSWKDRAGPEGVSRSRLRHAAAALTLATLSILVPQYAFAQDVRVLVTNTGQSSSSGLQTQGAQRFTTGANASGFSGFVLTSVGVQTRSIGSDVASSDTVVEIYTDNSGALGSLKATLTSPSTISHSSKNIFTAPSNTELTAGTSYWVVINRNADDADGAITVGQTSSGGEEDSGSLSDWSIRNSYLWRVAGNTGNWLTVSGWSLLIEINGYAKSDTTNTAPTASDGEVETNEDTDYTFEADDFNFADTDTGDTLSSVKITSLPGSGKGSLELDGTTISTTPQTVTKAQLDDDDLVYSPPANASGDDYTTFKFKVNDGDDDSASEYTMTIDVTAVNDAPVVDNAIPDQAATAGSAFSYAFPANTFSDVDDTSLDYTATRSDGMDLPSWLTFTKSTRTFSGTPAASDIGTLSVKVEAEDDDDASVSDTFDIVVSAADTTAPRLATISLQDPSSTPTNADTLKWRVTFSEDVKDVDGADFAVTGTTATLSVAAVGTSKSQYDVTATGGDLANLDDIVSLALRPVFNTINDLADNALTNTLATGTVRNTYRVDNTAPTITSILRHNPTAERTNANRLTWRVTFSEDVKNVDRTDFNPGITADIAVTSVGTSKSVYDVTLSGDNVVIHNGERGLVLLSIQNIKDLADNDLTNRSPTGENQKYTLDNRAPTFSSAAINGATLVITFNEDLDTSSTPPNSAFTVKKDVSGTATEQTLTGTPSVSGATVTLTLSTAVTSTDTEITVKYTKPGSGTDNKIRDTVGNETATFDDEDVTNSTTATCSDSTAIWCATLTVQPTSGGVIGCRNGTICGTALTDSDFTHDSVDYSISKIQGNVYPQIALNPNGETVFNSAAFTLHIGDGEYSFADATYSSGDFEWRSSAALSWSSGDSVDLKITHTPTLPATGKPAISGRAQAGHTLTAGKGTIKDASGTSMADNGDAGFAYTYQWVRVDGMDETDISGATSGTYTLQDADAGKTIKVKVSFTDDDSNPEGPLTSDAYPSAGNVKAAENATGMPSITGTATPGQTLTATKGTISDTDGTTKADNADAGFAYTYQWVRVDGMSETDIKDATSSTYTLTGGDFQKKIKVKVSFVDDAGTPEGPLTSASFPTTGAVACADSTALWCATLTVKDLSTQHKGCGALNACSSGLSVSRFTYDSTNYSVSKVRSESSTPGSMEQIDIAFNPNGSTVFNSADYTLHVGGTELSFGDATYSTTANDFTWDVAHATFRWSANDEIELKITKSVVTDTMAPTVTDIERQEPDTSPTNSDTLKWRVTFSEDVQNVDTTDFSVSGTTGTVTAVAGVSGSERQYDVTASGGDLANYDGTVTLSFASGQNITDKASTSNDLSNTTPTGTNDNTYVLDNTAPTFSSAAINGATLVITFNEDLDTSSTPPNSAFTVKKDVSGTATEQTLTGTPSVSGKTVTLALSTAVTSTDTEITVKYTKPGSGTDNRIRDALGNETATFDDDEDVTNNTTATNTAPTASDGEVETNEDTDYTFEADDFNFADTDTGDTLSSVKITSLPGSGKGSLEFDGTALTATDLPQTVTKAELDDDDLVYSPPADANGDDFATFKFKVNDGDDDSASEYTMTVDVDAVNDAPTVANAIPDQAAMAGSAFSYAFPANTFSDVDDTALEYSATKSDDTALPSWLTFTESTRTFSGTPTVSDIGTLSVKVKAEDDDDASVTDTFDIVVSAVADTTAPLVTSILRQDPGSSPTNNDTLKWRVTFSEDVQNVDMSDFSVSNTTASLAVAVVTGSESQYDVTASSGNLAGLNATVTLTLKSTGHGITDKASTPNALSNTTAATNESYVVDNTAPTFSSAVINGATLVITFSEDLDTTSSLANSAFTVKKDVSGTATDQDLTGTPSISGKTVTLTLDTAVTADDSDITVAYTRPSGTSNNKIRDEAANTAATFAARDVTNNTSSDTTPPFIVAADSTVNGATVTLTYSEALDESSVPTNNGFIVLRWFNEDDDTILGATTWTRPAFYCIAGNTAFGCGRALSATSVSGKTVVLTLPDLVKADASDRLVFQYSSGHAVNPIQDTTGNDAVSILTRQSLINRTPNRAPVASDSEVETNEDTDYPFDVDDFGFADSDRDHDLAGVKITSLPALGSLLYLDTAITASELPRSVSQTSLQGGRLVYRPPANASGNDYTSFKFKVNDSIDDSASEATMTIDVKAVNDAPVVDNAIPDQAATAGTAFRYVVPANTFSDVDSSTLTYSATQSDDTALPSWLTFTANTRTFSGTPAASDVGTLSVKVKASDASSGEVTDTFDIVVSAVVDTTAPLVTSILRQDPGTSPTNADTLKWRVTFNEDVQNVDAEDFSVFNTTATLAVAVVTGSESQYDVTASSGNLAGLNATVTLTLKSTGHGITDKATTPNALTNTTAATNESYVVDNTAPRVTSISRQTPISPTRADSVTWRVTFSEAVQNVGSSGFQLTGNPSVTASLTATAVAGSNDTQYDLKASGSALDGYNGTLTVSFASSHGIKDLADNALTNTTPTVFNENTYVLDNTVPTFSSAAIDGATLVITFSEDLAASPHLANSAFTVNKDVGGIATPQALTGAPSVSAKTVTLTLGTVVTSTDTSITVSYSKPGLVDSRLKDTARNEVANFANQPVTNNTLPTDTTAPRVTTILRQTPASSPTKEDSLTWRVTFNEDVKNVNAADFAIDGTSATLAVAAVSGSKSIYDVTASSGDLANLNATVTLSFASGQNIKDEADNDLDNTTPTGTNDNTYVVDNTGPAFSSASVNEDILVIIFNEHLGIAGNLANSAFTVKKDVGGTATVQTLTGTPLIRGTGVFLTLDAEMTTTDTGITVSYTRPTSGDYNRILDVAMNDAAGFSDREVTNETTVDTTPPTVTSIERRSPDASPTNSDTLTWRVTFSEDVRNVDGTDFSVSNTTATLAAAAVSGSGSRYDVTASGGNLPNLDATVALTLRSTGHGITDKASTPNALVNTTAGTNESYVVDNTAPALQTAVASGTVLTLTYDQALDGDSTPGAAAFTVTVTPPAGTAAAVAVTDVAVAGKVVTLSLARSLLATESIVLGYVAPASRPLRDGAGNLAANLPARAVSYRANSAAAGAPSITGTAEVGGTLTANRGTVSDANGVPAFPGGFRFQWIRVDADGVSNAADIPGATARTYRVMADDMGRRLRVRVSFNDRLGYAESRTSAAHPAGAVPYAAYLSALDAADQLGRTVRTAQAFSSLRDNYTARVGPDVESLAVTARTPAAGATVRIVAPNDPDGIDGNVVDLVDGRNLILVTVVLGGDTRRYILVVDRVADATAPGFESAAVDGDSLVIRYDEALDAGNTPAASAFTVTVAPAGGTAAAVKVAGVSVSGSTVTLTLESATALGDTATLGYAAPTVRWLRDTAGNAAADFSGRRVTNGSTAPALGLSLDAVAGDDVVNIAEKAAGFGISGATGSESGAQVTVEVGSGSLAATSGSGGAWSVTVPANAPYVTEGSLAVRVSAAKDGFVPRGAVRRVLAVDLTAPSAPSYGAPASPRQGDDIEMRPSGGGGIDSYRAADLPAGLSIDTGTGVISGTLLAIEPEPATATVTVSDAAGNTAAAEVVFPPVLSSGNNAAAGAPSISGEARVGATLSAGTGGITDPDGLAGVRFSYRWIRHRGGSTSDIAGATGRTYRLTDDDEGARIALRAEFDDEEGHAEALTGAVWPAGGRVLVARRAAPAPPPEAGVPEDWPLLPAGLGAGDRFRLLFVAPARNAVSTGIAAYNRHVQDAAAAGHAAVRPYGDGFRVLGSTVDVDARVNTGTTGNGGVRIYWLGGNKVADNNRDFYDGGWDDEGNARDAGGGSAFVYSANTYPWTGSGDDGSELVAGGVSRALGGLVVARGVPDSSAAGAGPLSGGVLAADHDVERPLYALSQVFRVAPLLSLALDGDIAGDGLVNIAEKAAGFRISGTTGPVGGASVRVDIDGTVLRAASSGNGSWSVDVPADADYVSGGALVLTVNASRDGYAAPPEVTHVLLLDLDPPGAPAYTAPAALAMGEEIAAMVPAGGADIDSYSAAGLPAGLSIDASTGVIGGAPTESGPGGTATVTVTDSAGNTAAVDIDFPAVAFRELPQLPLGVDAVAGDDWVNIAEKAGGFEISGRTGPVGGASVSVEIGGRSLPAATSDGGGYWSVGVPANADYVSGTLRVEVNAEKTGYLDAREVTRTLRVDLDAPTAPSYAAPASLQVGKSVSIRPSGGSGVHRYRAAGLPPDLAIDARTGVIGGAPRDETTGGVTVTVTVTDVAGNADSVQLALPAVGAASGNLPGAPRNVRVVSQTPASHPQSGNLIIVRWDAPETLAGDLVRYEHRYAAGAASVPSGTVWRSTRDQRFKDIYAQGGDSVAFEVRAVTGEGAGAAAALRFTATQLTPAISVANAVARESTDPAMVFTVRLDVLSPGGVSVEYETRGNTATENEDYTAVSGTLSFARGEWQKTIPVPIIADSHNDGGETFHLILSNPAGATLEDSRATGTILNTDPMPREWNARFGRTVGTQAVDAVTGRLGGGGQTHVTLGGRSLPLGKGSSGLAGAGAERDSNMDADMPDTDERSILTQEEPGGVHQASLLAPERTGPAGELEKVVAEWLRSSMGEDEELVLPDLDTLMLGSSFNLSLGDRGAGSGSQKEWSAWGRFARDSFEGAAEGLAVEGDVTTGFVGMDVESGSWLWGAALGISEGEGPYRMAENGSETAATEDDTPQWGSGRMESRLTAVYPYGRYAVTDRLDLWAMGGYGQGTMTVEPAGASALETDLGMTLGAIGARGNLREPPPEGGIALILRADALWVRTESEALRSGSGFLSGAQADTSRMRLILEGERAYRLTNGGTLTPALELGVRRDGGDAETGTGIETGARITFKRQGLAVEGAVRTLLSHEDEEYGEWGASASIRLEPGRDGRGLSFSVAPSWGATGSAAERLWGLDDTRGLAPEGEFEAGRRIDARVGYGLPVSGGRFTGTPEFGLGVSDGAREYRIGWRLSPVGGGIGPFGSFGIHVEAVREVPSRGESESRFGVVLEARF